MTSLRWLKVNPITAGVARMIGSVTCRNVQSWVFMASTGRCGTSTLRRLFENLPGCVAKHEPSPIMHDEIMADYNRGDDERVRREFLLRKLPRIYQATCGARSYVETNHMFIKCFAEEAVRAFGNKLRVVHLYRDADEVAASLYHRGSIPGTDYGDRWLLQPDAERNLIRCAEDGDTRDVHPYLRCLWYWYEIEARVIEFRDRHPDVPLVDIHTQELNDPDTVERLFCRLGFEFPDVVRKSVGLKENASDRKPLMPDDLDHDALSAAHVYYREQLECHGASGSIRSDAPRYSLATH